MKELISPFSLEIFFLLFNNADNFLNKVKDRNIIISFNLPTILWKNNIILLLLLLKNKIIKKKF